MQCPNCHESKIFRFVVQFPDSAEGEGEDVTACRDCHWNSLNIPGLAEAAGEEITREVEADRHFSASIAGTDEDSAWLQRVYQDELALLDRKKLSDMFLVIAHAESYTTQLVDLGHAEALEVYYRRRAELASDFSVNGWCYGLPRLLDDFMVWHGKLTVDPKEDSLLDDREIFSVKRMIEKIPVSLKRCLAIRYAIYLTMKPSIHSDLSDSNMAMNAAIYWAGSQPFQLYETLKTIGRFKEHGRRFKISRPLAKALSNTMPPKDWENMIRLPFPVTQIELPGPPPTFSYDTARGHHEYIKDAIAYCSYGADGRVQIGVTSKIGGMWGWLHFSSTPDYPESNPLLRVVVNALLYINSESANVVKFPAPPRSNKKPRTPRQQEKADRLIKYAYYSVGPDVTFRKMEAQTGPVPPSPLRRHTYRYLVRGHYKHQPFGSMKSQRKVIWIEPYWRGPDTGEVLGRAYVLTSSQRDERDF